MSVSDMQRAQLVKHANYLVNRAQQIHYAEVRPMESNRYHRWSDVVAHLGFGGSLTMDCSEAITSLFRWSGLRDPNGLAYNGEGYTGTLLSHLPHYVKTIDAHQGAIGIFGAWPGTHAIMVMQRNGNDPLVFSHGEEAGPFRLPLSAERTAHKGESLTWLDIGSL